MESRRKSFEKNIGSQFSGYSCAIASPSTSVRKESSLDLAIYPVVSSLAPLHRASSPPKIASRPDSNLNLLACVYFVSILEQGSRRTRRAPRSLHPSHILNRSDRRCEREAPHIASIRSSPGPTCRTLITVMRPRSRASRARRASHPISSSLRSSLRCHCSHTLRACHTPRHTFHHLTSLHTARPVRTVLIHI